MTAPEILISISLALNLVTGALLFSYMRDVNEFNKRQLEINDTVMRIINRMNEVLKK
jgi:hypothetical protein